MNNRAFKMFYTSVAINYEGRLIVIDNHCFVDDKRKMDGLIAHWNSQGRGKYHYYISVDNVKANAESVIESIHDLEYIH